MIINKLQAKKMSVLGKCFLHNAVSEELKLNTKNKDVMLIDWQVENN